MCVNVVNVYESVYMGVVCRKVYPQYLASITLQWYIERFLMEDARTPSDDLR